MRGKTGDTGEPRSSIRRNSIVMRKQTTARPEKMPMKIAKSKKKRSPCAGVSGVAVGSVEGGLVREMLEVSITFATLLHLGICGASPDHLGFGLRIRSLVRSS